MKEILPIIIVCSVGLAVCLALLIAIFVKHLKGRKKHREEFELDDGTLVISLDAKDFRK